MIYRYTNLNLPWLLNHPCTKWPNLGALCQSPAGLKLVLWSQAPWPLPRWSCAPWWASSAWWDDHLPGCDRPHPPTRSPATHILQHLRDAQVLQHLTTHFPRVSPVFLGPVFVSFIVVCWTGCLFFFDCSHLVVNLPRRWFPSGPATPSHPLSAAAALGLESHPGRWCHPRRHQRLFPVFHEDKDLITSQVEIFWGAYWNSQSVVWTLYSISVPSIFPHKDLASNEGLWSFWTATPNHGRLIAVGICRWTA